MNEEQLTIAQMAERMGLSAHTLRYYERIGLLDPVGRATSGHRRYRAQDIVWVEFLSRLRATGMPIHLMQQYAELRRQGSRTLRARRALLEAHQGTVNARIGALQQNLAVIEQKICVYQEMEERDEHE